MKVGVFAGTFIDTKMGADLLEANGYEAISFPLSKNPKEQTQMQYYSREELGNIVLEKARQGMKEGVEKIFIYCNSLSSAIDYEKIQEELGIPVITPLETYKKLPEGMKNIAIVAANGISAYGIDQMITASDEEIQTLTFGNLPVVLDIEEGKSPQKILEELNLYGWLDYLEGIQDPRYKIHGIVLGCTHFPHIKEELEKATNIPFIDPTEDMLKRLRAE